MRVLGFMTGTSLDAVDIAVLDTDGEAIQGFGPAGERKLSEHVRELLLEATAQALKWRRDTPEPLIFEDARAAVAVEHINAAEAFLSEHGLGWADLDLIGVHGQTVLHERPEGGRPGRSVQLIDPERVARRARRPVVWDFRGADVAAGGEGAPLTPAYHMARARQAGLQPPLAVLNLGGVANFTMIDRSGAPLAFDTGPGNGMIDLLVQQRGEGRYDEGGQLAAAGTVDRAVLAGLLDHPFFSAPPPKSLDRYDFPISALDGLTTPDACATLVAFTAEAARRGFAFAVDRPQAVIVCGGGRHNPELMLALQASLPVPVSGAEVFGWRGDAVEAEAIAYLAARAVRGLPTSFPSTTGVREPVCGGRVVQPPR
jgi:anhydro-N-acetylmuramic acid kinase